MLLLRSGVWIVAISELLGHTTATVTMNVCAHVGDDSLQEAAGRLDGLLGTGS
jgi:hypothetical protein